jgi:peptidoglycan/xylan/chitin deacetylase (PgdA/CDA1 family)
MIRQETASSQRAGSAPVVARSSAVILLYHRVIDLPSDPQSLCVAPRNFEQHLQVLRERFRVDPLETCTERLKHGNPAAGTVVITFDDGYADNLDHAKPLLARFDCPATVFVTARRERSDREFWWDELERLIIEPGNLPRRLRIGINGEPFEWDFEGSAARGAHDARAHAGWNVLTNEDPTRRHALYRILCGKLRPLPVVERNRLLDGLRTWAGVPPTGRATHRTLTDEQIAELATGGLIEIGAHSVTHSVLANQPLESQREEITASKARLERIIDGPVCSFSYPFGGRRDYTTATVDLVRRAGFSRACSSFAAPIDPNTDPFQLPRHIVRDWDGDTFATRLKAWFSGE